MKRREFIMLLGGAPDVILATGTSTLGPLLRLTHTVPIVFPIAADPVATGLVESLARPGGNATGFMSSKAAPARNGSNCSKRSHPACRRAIVATEALPEPRETNHECCGNQWIRRSWPRFYDLLYEDDGATARNRDLQQLRLHHIRGSRRLVSRFDFASHSSAIE